MIETARRFPSMNYIERIAKAFDIQVYELLKELDICYQCSNI